MPQQLTITKYRHFRRMVMRTDEGRKLVEWSQNIRHPADADDLAQRLIGAILSSGFSYESAMRVVPRVLSALLDGRPVSPEFGHKRKARAIETVWQERHTLLKSLPRRGSLEDAFEWCEWIPFVRGPALRYQAVRDLGLADVAKPDRMIERIADRSGESVQGLCERLAQVAGDSVGTVDVVLWYAASKGMIEGIRMHRRRPPCHAVPLNRPPTNHRVL